MKSPPAPETDLFDGNGGQENDFELSFQTELDAQDAAEDLLRDWTANSESSESQDHDSPNLLYENLLQQRWQEQGLSGSFTGFPVPADARASYASAHRSISSASHRSPSEQLVLPEINQSIYGFQLLHELGRGSFARVFMAKQGDLADREVVLKISKIEGGEAQTLAQLQHTHVVPVYSVHQDTFLGLRAVCMPYFGGACLAKVQEKVWDGRGLPVSGMALIEALDSVAGPEPAVRLVQHADADTTESNPVWKSNLQSVHTARNTLTGLTYVQAAVWIVCRLAEGLHHSHERNVIHRDIKPSNILISAEAQPLLLDFNVSQAIDCDLADATLGGTIAYMSPEQLRAVIKRDKESLIGIGHQSDIYSLGLVLYEMLNGPSPFSETVTATVDSRSLDAMLQERERPVPSLKAQCALEIPWSLESIVRKSLAPNPAQRYQTAAQFGEDLNRFLQDQPLKYAPELSRVEQMKKWARRHPKLTSSIIVTLAALALILPGAQLLSATREDLVVQRNLLEGVKAAKQARDFQSGAQRALCLVNTVIPNEETFRAGMAVCEETLAIYGIVTNLDWQEGTYWQLLAPDDRTPVAESARELLLVLAAAHVRTLPGKDAAVLTALNLLKKAEGIRDLAPSRALSLDRARYLTLLKRDADAQKTSLLAESIPVVTAHDTYMLASAYARSGTPEGYHKAVKLLTKSIQLSPEHYWSYFERALCHLALQESLLAATDFGTCIGLWPESSWAYFSRGYVLEQGGHKQEAVNDYTQAIQHSPRYVSAYFNRGLLNLELRRPKEALADFEKVRALGRHDSIIDAARAMALEGLGRQTDADHLFADVLQQSEAMADQTSQRIAWTYAFAIAHRKPDEAGQIFKNILKFNPKHPQAHYGEGMLSMNQGHLAEAVRSFDAALAADPKFIEPLRYRAISLARLGQMSQAVSDANACVEREPTNPDSLYIAACVAAISARKYKTEVLWDSALELLRKAIECGADPERALDDPDFSGLRGQVEFQKLVRPKQKPKSQILNDL
jgi:serine/threonine protein kinase/Flp pilus assembly protein TadD